MSESTFNNGRCFILPIKNYISRYLENIARTFFVGEITS